jgi:hypothetical protein
VHKHGGRSKGPERETLDKNRSVDQLHGSLYQQTWPVIILQHTSAFCIEFDCKFFLALILSNFGGLTSLIMIRLSAKNREFIRVFCAMMIVCLFSLHGSFSQARLGWVGIEAAYSPNCGASVDGKMPIHEHHKDASCCILCQTVSPNKAFFVFTVLLILIPVLGATVPAYVVNFDGHDTLRRLIGFTSVWSSRAPPLFY